MKDSFVLTMNISFEFVFDLVSSDLKSLEIGLLIVGIFVSARGHGIGLSNAANLIKMKLKGFLFHKDITNFRSSLRVEH